MGDRTWLGKFISLDQIEEIGYDSLWTDTFRYVNNASGLLKTAVAARASRRLQRLQSVVARSAPPHGLSSYKCSVVAQ
jgi:hypothetical protein